MCFLDIHVPVMFDFMKIVRLKCVSHALKSLLYICTLLFVAIFTPPFP